MSRFLANLARRSGPRPAVRPLLFGPYDPVAPGGPPIEPLEQDETVTAPSAEFGQVTGPALVHPAGPKPAAALGPEPAAARAPRKRPGPTPVTDGPDLQGPGPVAQPGPRQAATEPRTEETPEPPAAGRPGVAARRSRRARVPRDPSSPSPAAEPSAVAAAPGPARPRRPPAPSATRTAAGRSAPVAVGQTWPPAADHPGAVPASPVERSSDPARAASGPGPELSRLTAMASSKTAPEQPARSEPSASSATTAATVQRAEPDRGVAGTASERRRPGSPSPGSGELVAEETRLVDLERRQAGPEDLAPATHRRTAGRDPVPSGWELPGQRRTEATSAAPPAPTVQVTIGRVEVRTAAPAPRPARAPSRSEPIGLDEYLRQRSGGGGGP